MSIRPKKSKQEVLSNVLGNIIDEFFSKQRGIVVPATNIILKDYLKKADENKEGAPSIYYLIKALAEMAKGNIQAAGKFCSNATRLDPNHPTIMSNYATILYLLGRHEEVKEIVKKLFDEKNVSPKGDGAAITNLMHSSLVTLDTSYYESSNVISTINGWNDIVDYIKRIKNDIYDVSSDEYTEFMKQLELFVFVKTRQMAAYRLSIENGLDRYLKIEIFLDINADEASYLNSEFTTYFVDYVFEKDRHDLLGKFVVFFKQNESRNDGTENSNALYLGMNEELVA